MTTVIGESAGRLALTAALCAPFGAWGVSMVGAAVRAGSAPPAWIWVVGLPLMIFLLGCAGGAALALWKLALLALLRREAPQHVAIVARRRDQPSIRSRSAPSPTYHLTFDMGGRTAHVALEHAPSAAVAVYQRGEALVVRQRAAWPQAVAIDWEASAQQLNP